jgi:hypothetical protein
MKRNTERSLYYINSNAATLDDRLHEVGFLAFVVGSTLSFGLHSWLAQTVTFDPNRSFRPWSS